ncbi:hypothetical protein MNBD_GAMMA08-85 [hydrothermal vent metagenome]|uniref:Uncharacterized protein n=1 Tax=hydrothermal vent metagenome TaxID=652676 RepID=A0A3B0YGB8_9ZZZZ
MKLFLRQIFSPVLSLFESGNETYAYKKSHRTVLIIMGILFSGLATAVFFLAQGEDIGYLIPVVVFGGAGLLSLLIGLIGNNRAVAKIWGSGNK